jgi:hypothetical protein
MRSGSAIFIALVFSGGLVIGTTFPSIGRAQEGAPDLMCGASSVPQLRTTLYFGLQRPKGAVSELDWQMFLRDEVTPRFPEGLTVWEAQGQWKGSDGTLGHERSKVLLLVHPETRIARAAVQSVIARYRRMFDQQSVLWETSRVCTMS